MTAVRVWAPNVSRLRLVAGGEPQDLEAAGDGWWQGPDLAPGTDYGFLLDDDDQPVPDPASRWQPDGVHGLSRVYDQSGYQWHDADWHGVPFDDAVVYELHIGTFTEGATFDSAIERLDHLADLGVTHVEVLPINDFNGVWNWGYDGVAWYAVHETYGGPDGFKRFVDACHGRGLAVVLDVVYNHLGPSGNYLPKFMPIFKQERNTWGDLVNFEARPIRDFVLDNALMWLQDFHVDALRLDAVHALQPELNPPAPQKSQHILAELSDRVHALDLGRPLTLIAESDLNDPLVITPTADGGWGMDAQWDDDVHHALHSLVTGETQGYYCDFGPLPVLEKVMTHAFLHDGTYSTFRGRDHGAPVDREHTPGWRFVVTLQNHDQVGNRAVGDRLPELTTPGLVKVGAVLLLTSPFTPMLWMGEEWAASTRWPFFTSHPEPELAEATAKGRVEEFGSHGWDVSQMIDPQDPAAYRGAILRWDEAATGEHADVLGLYRDLIRLRHDQADLRDPDLSAVQVEYDEDKRWVVIHRGQLRVAVNLASEAQDVPVSAQTVLLSTDSAEPNGQRLKLAGESAAVVS
jgi:maltooligosyltrehalose trehalohydrolase